MKVLGIDLIDAEFERALEASHCKWAPFVGKESEEGKEKPAIVAVKGKKEK